jgi:hypothetical protein
MMALAGHPVFIVHERSPDEGIPIPPPKNEVAVGTRAAGAEAWHEQARITVIEKGARKRLCYRGSAAVRCFSPIFNSQLFQIYVMRCQ